MSKINILAISPDKYGVGKFRIIDPYTHLQENHGDDFHVDLKYDVPNEDSAFDNYDIIVLHSFIHISVPPETNIDRINWLKSKGKIVIVDIDDFWEPPQNHPSYHQAMNSKMNKYKQELLLSASYITTTTTIYADFLRKRLKTNNVVVFPNAIDPKEKQFTPNPTKSERMRFGWSGGSSHYFDLDMMRSGIKVIGDTYKEKVQFVLCGFDISGEIIEINRETREEKKRPIKPRETSWYQYEKIFTNNYQFINKEYLSFLVKFKNEAYDDLNEIYRRRWTENINKYGFNYNHYDVSLIPLVDNTFNNYKSQLKIIESGFHKKAVIVSDTDPYTIDLINLMNKGGSFNDKGNSLLVEERKSHKQWHQHMKRLIESPNLVEDLGNKLYETVKDTYSHDKVNKDRTEFFKSIIK